MAVTTMDGSSGPGSSDDAEATRRYLEGIRALHREWDELDSRGDDSVRLSGRVRSALSDAVRADARHGAPVRMPPTDLGEYSVSESALRSLLRETVDSVPGAVSLRTELGRAADARWGTGGPPERVRCRVSFASTTRDLLALADTVRGAVLATCARELALTDLAVDIHIEDLHED